MRALLLELKVQVQEQGVAGNKVEDKQVMGSLWCPVKGLDFALQAAGSLEGVKHNQPALYSA